MEMRSRIQIRAILRAGIRGEFVRFFFRLGARAFGLCVLVTVFFLPLNFFFHARLVWPEMKREKGEKILVRKRKEEARARAEERESE